MNKNKLEIVISKYKEDISWVSKLSDIKTIIYNKGDKDDNLINLENIGREAHTYLTHIVNNYDNLSEYTCFLQGHPFDHLDIDLNDIPKLIESGEDFISLNRYFECDLNGSPHHNGLELEKLIFDEYFTQKPNKVKFVVGAQFIASRKIIHKRKKEFYEVLIEKCQISNNEMPWVLERVWSYIFNEKYKTIKYDQI